MKSTLHNARIEIAKLMKDVADLRKENTELRNLVAEARDGFGEIVSMVNEAQKMIATQKPDDAA